MAARLMMLGSAVPSNQLGNGSCLNSASALLWLDAKLERLISLLSFISNIASGKERQKAESSKPRHSVFIPSFVSELEFGLLACNDPLTLLGYLTHSCLLMPVIVFRLKSETLGPTKLALYFTGATNISVYIWGTCCHSFITFGFACTPLYFVWEKAIGMHKCKSLCKRAAARLPVVVPIWFLAIVFPFFGPINSAVGSLLVSFTVYIIPALAHMFTFKSATARENAVEKPPKFVGRWVGAFTINVFVVVWVFVVGFGFGGWASMTNFIRQIDNFGFFAKCYQCPPPPPPPPQMRNYTVAAPPPLHHHHHR
ncbi:Auxin transporter-like protein 5 [Cucurbita argyrosperma subsp. argyrosperma]|nr:Auxin transporter-like protein 5 [Cucurbita argyrosperma subsp. argyrosperma]